MLCQLFQDKIMFPALFSFLQELILADPRKITKIRTRKNFVPQCSLFFFIDFHLIMLISLSLPFFSVLLLILTLSWSIKSQKRPEPLPSQVYPTLS